jgi:hypothetical protein
MVQNQPCMMMITLRQRQLIETLRNTDRSPASSTGQYMQVHIKHHIAESYDEVWRKSPQALLMDPMCAGFNPNNKCESLQLPLLK